MRRRRYGGWHALPISLKGREECQVWLQPPRPLLSLADPSSPQWRAVGGSNCPRKPQGNSFGGRVGYLPAGHHKPGPFADSQCRSVPRLPSPASILRYILHISARPGTCALEPPGWAGIILKAMERRNTRLPIENWMTQEHRYQSSYLGGLTMNNIAANNRLVVGSNPTEPTPILLSSTGIMTLL